VKYVSDSAQGSGGNAGGDGRRTTAVFTLDGKMNQAPDAADPRPAYNYKRIANWDGARLVLRTIHGLNKMREVWVLGGNVLKSQRAAQTPGGADSATRDLVYNKRPWPRANFTTTYHRDTETPRNSFRFCLGASVPRCFVTVKSLGNAISQVQVPAALEDHHDPGLVERAGAQFEQKLGCVLPVSARNLQAAGPNILGEDG